MGMTDDESRRDFEEQARYLDTAPQSMRYQIRFRGRLLCARSPELLKKKYDELERQSGGNHEDANRRQRH
jgi:hypothetical protein